MHDSTEVEIKFLTEFFKQLNLREEYHQYLYGIIFCHEVEEHIDNSCYKHSILFVLEANPESSIFAGNKICSNIKRGDIFYLNNNIGHGLKVKEYGQPFVAMVFDFPYKIAIDILKRLDKWKKNTIITQ